MSWKVATWNVNSVRARGERLVSWLQRHTPDVVCLQELKGIAEQFPWEAMQKLGYHAAVNGQKTYNGVAILARDELSDIVCGMQDGSDDVQARLIAATVQGVRVVSVYVPNGSRVGTDKYQYKLAWMVRLRAYLETHCKPDQPLLVCGDFNVAPRLCDVAQPQQWESTVLFCPEVREHLVRVTDFGLVDIFAKHYPSGGEYSWWDYRMLGFAKNNGLRIDVIYASEALACRSTEASIDRQERKGTLPSDHAPVLAVFDWP